MKIICVGRNFAAHASELNHEIPSEPILFMKPKTSLLQNNQPFYYPEFTKALHYECEIVLHICKNGRNIPREMASNYFDWVTVGIDFTARDLQDRLKSKGLPWEISKAFDHSAVLGQWITTGKNLNTLDIPFFLRKNGEMVQQGNSRDLIFSFDSLLHYISIFFSLNIGDLVFTGTPQGVGPVQVGDQLEAYIGDECLLALDIL